MFGVLLMYESSGPLGGWGPGMCFGRYDAVVGSVTWAYGRGSWWLSFWLRFLNSTPDVINFL